MSEAPRTPNTEQVRAAYAEVDTRIVYRQLRGSAFDRWLAIYSGEVAALALEQAGRVIASIITDHEESDPMFVPGGRYAARCLDALAAKHRETAR